MDLALDRLHVEEGIRSRDTPYGGRELYDIYIEGYPSEAEQIL